MSPSNRSLLVERRRLMRVFRVAGATTPKGTIIPEEYGVDKGLVFQRLMEREILKETSPGWFYLDEERLNYLKRRDSRVSTITFILIIVVALSIFLIISRNSWK